MNKRLLDMDYVQNRAMISVESPLWDAVSHYRLDRNGNYQMDIPDYFAINSLLPFVLISTINRLEEL